MDTRKIPADTLGDEFDSFMDFVTLPCSVAFGPDSTAKIEIIIKRLNELSLDYYEEKGYSSDLKPMIRIMK